MPQQEQSKQDNRLRNASCTRCARVLLNRSSREECVRAYLLSRCEGMELKGKSQLKKRARSPSRYELQRLLWHRDRSFLPTCSHHQVISVTDSRSQPSSNS